MNWTALATLIQAAATVIALVGVAVTFVLTSRGQKQDKELAQRDMERAERAEVASAASAERAERAASLSIDTLTRIAIALEGVASSRFPGAGERRSGAAVAWRLNHFNGDMYILENQGDAVAHGVQLSAHESLMAPGEWPARQEVGPGEALTFMAVRTFGTSDSTITVEWSDSDDEGAERKVWRYPLPPRPPR